MATGIQNHFIQELLGRIGPLAAQLEPPLVHWIGGSDESLSYCGDCIEGEISKLKVNDPDAEFFKEGGYDPHHVSDSTPCCEVCGCTLGYSLSRHGMADELDAFSEATFHAAALTPEAAYAIEAILMAAVYCDDPALVDDAISVGTVFSSAMPTADKPSPSI